MRSILAFIALLLLALVAFLLWPIGVPDKPPHQTLIVLGAAQYSGRPSPAFRVRLDHALALYEAGGVQRIVVTGGRREGDPFSEGGVGVSYLHSQGVPSSALIAEERSRTTWQNLNYARELLPTNTPITVVTDKAHAPRSLAMAKAMGFSATASPSPLWPNVSLHYLIRERIALAAFYLFGENN